MTSVQKPPTLTRPAAIQFAADFLAVVAAYYTTLVVRFYSVWGARFFTFVNRGFGVRETGELGTRLQIFYEISGPRIILFLTGTLCVLYALQNLYAGRRFVRRRPIAWNVFLANVIALLLFFTYFYLRRNIFHPRSYFATMIALNTIFCIMFRHMAEWVLRVARRRLGYDVVKTILVGNDESADFLAVYLEVTQPHGILVTRRVETSAQPSTDALCREIAQHVSDEGIGLVIVADNNLSVNDIMRLIGEADDLKIPIKVLSDNLGVLMTHARLPVDMIHGSPLVHFDRPHKPSASRIFRRVFDATSATVLLVLLMPWLLIIAVCVRLTSPGAVLFIQERIGINRKPFRMYKFRTMKDRASELQAQLEEFNESSEGLLFKMKKDPRVTAIGRVLRRFSLDELPQLWNVLRGEMSFVGPRPLPQRDFENYYEDWHYSRHGGLPGLTCLWQISGRSELDFHNMCLLDIYYLHNRSWVLDLKIVLRTAVVVLFGKGAY